VCIVAVAAVHVDYSDIDIVAVAAVEEHMPSQSEPMVQPIARVEVLPQPAPPLSWAQQQRRASFCPYHRHEYSLQLSQLAQ
jgi:hypothetical protein